MIIVLKPGATQAEIDHVIEKIQAAGCTPHLSRGVERTIIGAIGDEAALRNWCRWRSSPASTRSCRSRSRTRWSRASSSPTRA